MNKLSVVAAAKIRKRSLKSTQKRHEERGMNKKLKKSKEQLKHEREEKMFARIDEGIDRMFRQSEMLHRRVDLMYQLSDARKNGDFDKFAELAESLKLLLTGDNERY